MKINVSLLLLLAAAVIPFSLRAQADSSRLATPNASEEAKQLYAYLTSISGRKTLAGQHCAPLIGSTRLAVVHRKTGHYPAVFGQDFGFSYPGYWDGINFRQKIVDEAIRRHREGFIITLMWHAVPPTMNEPVSFEEGVQSSLTDRQWQALITPGTYLHERWKSQVDVIAWFLRQLQYARVPVIWRPYHEMNGGWFWWGKRRGENGYKQLYRMLYDRLVNFHRLRNLIWVYNTNEVKLGVDAHEDYYPGDAFVDIIATDVYRTAYDDKNYQQLKALAGPGKKLLALGEVGLPPSPRLLEKQPEWLWFMKWDDPGEEDPELFKKLYQSTQVLKLGDMPWTQLKKVRMHYPVLGE